MGPGDDVLEQLQGQVRVRDATWATWVTWLTGISAMPLA